MEERETQNGLSVEEERGGSSFNLKEREGGRKEEKNDDRQEMSKKYWRKI
jgi:hypothetical protein